MAGDRGGRRSLFIEGVKEKVSGGEGRGNPVTDWLKNIHKKEESPLEEVESPATISMMTVNGLDLIGQL